VKKTRSIYYLFLVFSLLFLMLYNSSAEADASDASTLPEQKIKAIYLYKFIHFIKWPDALLSAGNITIGILGKDDFSDAFSEVEGKRIKSLDKKLVIKRFGTYSDKHLLKECHLLFISSSEKSNFKKIIKQISGKKILTFADTEGFLEAGGMIKFINIEDKIRWEINKIAIDNAGIRLNSQIFQCALKVIQ